ncbi:thioredoxin [Plantactinospora siamensis]|uniref:Thioredoxin n=1 Tax=Plantactinospora siamensis TaxID=555372 RepID=A0ABV6P0L6_9ACTN
MPNRTDTAIPVVTDDSFGAEVLNSELPVLVDFWADWCPPCKAISASLTELAGEFSGRVRVVTLNSDENPAATRAYGVMSLPTLLVFREGEVVGSLVGARPKSHLRNFLDRYAG